MTDRASERAAFLQRSGWGDAKVTPLAGDASARRYERLVHGAARAVLMDAPRDAGEGMRRFARMDRWLRTQGYSAPAILAEDNDAGFLLLEDLGDALLARVLDAGQDRETELYLLATDFLADLHARPVPRFVTPLLSDGLSELAALAPEWLARARGVPPSPHATRIPDLVGQLFGKLTDGQIVVSLRDFHAENLILLEDRSGLARLGLLDFQDAVATHPAYDLVSLLQDARRDVSPATEAAMVAHYCATKGLDPDAFGATYALLGAQRALRIVGVFVRLACRDGRDQYLRYLPRVWAALKRNLLHPALSDLRQAIEAGLPEPDITRLTRSERGA